MLCQNCEQAAHADHNDLCCTCFHIMFGDSDHRAEHWEARKVGSETYLRNQARAMRASVGQAMQEAGLCSVCERLDARA